MFLDYLKKEENITYTENGAVTYRSTRSHCLDLFATIGALRNSEESEIVSRFIKAYAEDADMAMKTLFFTRDIRSGLGERKVFKTILAWLAVNELQSVRKNIAHIAEYGRYDDLLVLLETPCEKDMIAYIQEQMEKDIRAFEKGDSISLLAKWLPSVNTSNREAVRMAKKLARAMGLTEEKYRKTLTALRAHIKIIENNLREKDYTFEYEKQPSKALYKYRKAFLRHDEARYQAFLKKVEMNLSMMHTGTLTPYDVIAPIITKAMKKMEFTEDERYTMEVTWQSLENFVGSENALAIVDGSASMYWTQTRYLPAAVAQSLGIYFAEHNKGRFHNHFITFSESPRLVEIKGRDIVEKVKYCMSYNEFTNTNLKRTFDLILQTAIHNKVKQKDMPEKLYIISDMEFDLCASNADMTNFEVAKEEFKQYGYKLPKVIFWNVASRKLQQPVTKNEQGVALISGCSPHIFGMLSKDSLDPYSYMRAILSSKRYEKIAA